MNKVRRKKIQALIDMLGGTQDEIKGLLDEEQNYLDAMPTGIAASHRGERAEEVVGLLTLVTDNLTEAADLLSEAAE